MRVNNKVMKCGSLHRWCGLQRGEAIGCAWLAASRLNGLVRDDGETSVRCSIPIPVSKNGKARPRAVPL